MLVRRRIRKEKLEQRLDGALGRIILIHCKDNHSDESIYTWSYFKLLKEKNLIYTFIQSG